MAILLNLVKNLDTNFSTTTLSSKHLQNKKKVGHVHTFLSVKKHFKYFKDDKSRLL